MPGRPGLAFDDHDNGSWQEAAVRVLILASAITDNTPNGYYWTFLFPMLLFIFIATILYLLFSRPHRRTPVRAIEYPGATRPGSWTGAAASSVGGATVVSARAPAAEAGSAAEPEAEAGSAAEPAASDGEQAEGDAASAGDAESSE
jgi:hypothetical protein